MAEPVGFQGANVLMSGEKAGCRDLEVFTDGKEFISCWRFTADEINTIVKSGVVWLSVYGSCPPVLLSADPLVTCNGQPSKAEPFIPKRN